MSNGLAIVIIYIVTIVMSGLSAWSSRKKNITTRGGAVLACVAVLIPVVNLAFAVADVIDGEWGSKQINW